MKRSKIGYRKRLKEDLEMAKAQGMSDVVDIIEKKIEEHKQYQKNYYNKKKVK